MAREKGITIKHFDNKKVKPYEDGTLVKYVRVIYDRKSIEFPSYYYELQNQGKGKEYEPDEHNLYDRRDDFEQNAFGDIKPKEEFLDLELDLIRKIVVRELSIDRTIFNKKFKFWIESYLCSIGYVLDGELIRESRLLNLEKYGFDHKMIFGYSHFGYSEILKMFSSISSDGKNETDFYRQEIKPWKWYLDFVESAQNPNPLKIIRVIDWFSDKEIPKKFNLQPSNTKFILRILQNHFLRKEEITGR